MTRGIFLIGMIISTCGCSMFYSGSGDVVLEINEVQKIQDGFDLDITIYNNKDSAIIFNPLSYITMVTSSGDTLSVDENRSVLIDVYGFSVDAGSSGDFGVIFNNIDKEVYDNISEFFIMYRYIYRRDVIVAQSPVVEV